MIVKIIFTCSKITLLIFYIMLLILVILAALLFSLNDSKKVFVYNEEERQEYLSELCIYGIGSPQNTSTVTIPWEFDDVYLEYNKIQQKAGYDLREYAGDTVQEFTYEYKGYIIHLLIKNGEVVGGDISDPIINGKILPLTKEYANELNAS